MSRRPDIELPDDLATYAEGHQAEVEHAIEDAYRRTARRAFPAALAALGVVITDADRRAARDRLAALRPALTDDQHAANLAMLDDDGQAA